MIFSQRNIMKDAWNSVCNKCIKSYYSAITLQKLLDRIINTFIKCVLQARNYAKYIIFYSDTIA